MDLISPARRIKQGSQESTLLQAVIFLQDNYMLVVKLYTSSKKNQHMWLTCQGEVWSAFYEFKLWFLFNFSYFGIIWSVIFNWILLSGEKHEQLTRVNLDHFHAIQRVSWMISVHKRIGPIHAQNNEMKLLNVGHIKIKYHLSQTLQYAYGWVLYWYLNP